MLTYFLLDTPVPIGRGAVRGGNRGIETTASYYRAPRPESSKKVDGKQGNICTYVPLIIYTVKLLQTDTFQ